MLFSPTDLVGIRRRVILLFMLLGISAAVLMGHALTQSRAVIGSPLNQTSVSTRSDDQNPVVTNIDLINVSVTVTDSDGRHVSGLGKSAFTLFDDKLPQEISFFSDSDMPISIAVIYDTSKSMDGEKIIHAREALARFIETSHRSDEYFIINFNDRARLLFDGTQDAGAVLDKFTYVKPDGETALYDATYLGVEKVSRGSRARRALLLITDGNDTCSRYTLRDVSRALQESDVVVYAIGILAFSRTEARAGRMTLKELTSVSGGKAYFPKSNDELMKVFEQIALELRAQYLLGYRPTDLTGSRKWHRIKVDLNSADKSRLTVRSREGAYAPN